MNKLQMNGNKSVIQGDGTGSTGTGNFLDYDSRANAYVPPHNLPKLTDLITPEAIKAELKKLKWKRTPGIDGKTAEQLSKELTSDRLGEIVRYTISGQYFPKSLKICKIPKGSGGTRTISIPAILDAVIMRILAKALAEALEPHLMSSTIGYRTGKCIEDALLMCTRNIQSGYKVFETDIEGFFDNVNRDRLMEKLFLISQDPVLHQLVRRFLEVPRLEHDRKSVPELGIPQGSPLSPVLANLYLLPLDQELVRQGLKYVRYADDLVVFFDENKEVHPERVIKNKLGMLGLNCKANKTRAISPAKGECFHFLGMTVQANGQISHNEDRILQLVEHPQLHPFLQGLERHRRVNDVSSFLIALGLNIKRNLNFVPNLCLDDSQLKSHFETIIEEAMLILRKEGAIRKDDKKVESGDFS